MRIQLWRRFKILSNSPLNAALLIALRRSAHRWSSSHRCRSLPSDPLLHRQPPARPPNDLRAVLQVQEAEKVRREEA